MLANCVLQEETSVQDILFQHLPGYPESLCSQRQIGKTGANVLAEASHSETLRHCNRIVVAAVCEDYFLASSVSEALYPLGVAQAYFRIDRSACTSPVFSIYIYISLFSWHSLSQFVKIK
jgi:hypothetical protein